MNTGRVTLRIRGKVQGVFFRESTRREAERLALRGYVKNLPSGEVLAVAEGAPPALGALIAWCKKGPPLAQVDDVEVAEQPATSEFSSFTVER